MTKEEIFARLSEVLQETFGIAPEKITPAARLYEDLDIDSIDAVDMMVKLRSLTERRLQPEAFRSVRTVGDVVEALYRHLTEKA
ncbi:MAG: acyl carrier protein [Nevskiaceae bacterium]|jgi:acyl carrier protein|nr:acyl carrier protein [Nevskiaceae bacterium]